MDIDPRGPRFGAVITTVVLAVVLITGSAWLLGAQLLVFAIGALFGLRYAPYGIVYRRLVRPRLGPPARTEAEAPPRFSQGVGMVFAAGGVLGYVLGATAVGIGRPYAYGLALGGVDGIVHVLRAMVAEADLIMAVDGYPTLKDLTPETLRRVD